MNERVYMLILVFIALFAAFPSVNCVLQQENVMQANMGSSSQVDRPQSLVMVELRSRMFGNPGGDDVDADVDNARNYDSKGISHESTAGSKLKNSINKLKQAVPEPVRRGIIGTKHLGQDAAHTINDINKELKQGKPVNCLFVFLVCFYL
jgi:hypothetical protein